MSDSAEFEWVLDNEHAVLGQHILALIKQHVEQSWASLPGTVTNTGLPQQKLMRNAIYNQATFAWKWQMMSLWIEFPPR